MNFKTIHKQSTMMRGAGLMNARPHERINLWYLLVAITLLLLLAEMGRPQEPGKAQSQTTSPQTLVPVTVTVSVETKHAGDFPVIYPEDVRVFQGKDRLKVTQWVPAEGDGAGLQLMVVVDDACDTHKVGQIAAMRVVPEPLEPTADKHGLTRIKRSDGCFADDSML